MAYTNTIDPTLPPFDGFVGQGDDELRKLKADLLERMNTLVVDFNANPLILKSSAVTNTSGFRQVSHLAFQPRDDQSPISRGVGSLSPRTHVSLVTYGEVLIPEGVLITGTVARIYSASTATVVGSLYRAFDGGGPTALTTFSAVVGAGWQSVTGSSTVLPFTVVSGDRFIFLITLDTTTSANVNDAQLAWASILVATPVA